MKFYHPVLVEAKTKFQSSVCVVVHVLKKVTFVEIKAVD